MDICCAVCQEPWDWYGVNHTDMNEYERLMFKKGQGCPVCGFVHNELTAAQKMLNEHKMTINVEEME